MKYCGWLSMLLLELLRHLSGMTGTESTKKSNSDLLGFPHKRKNSVIPHTDSEVIRHTFSLHSVRLSPILRQWSVFVCPHLMLGDEAEIGHVPSLFRKM